MRITRENRNFGFILQWLAFFLAFEFHQPWPKRKSTNQKVGGKNQPMTVGVWNASVNQTPTLIEAKINQLEGLAEKTYQWQTVSGMPASIKQGPWSKRKSTNQKAWREKPANDWQCLERKRQSNTNPGRSEKQPIRRLGGKNQPMTDCVWDAGVSKKL